jgi:hypothetical protein
MERLIIDISVAIITTKIPMLSTAGFRSMAHEARTDCCMLLGLIFLLLVGSGPFSFDQRFKTSWQSSRLRTGDELDCACQPRSSELAFVSLNLKLGTISFGGPAARLGHQAIPSSFKSVASSAIISKDGGPVHWTNGAVGVGA